MKIYGAGISGLLAGCVFQNAYIFEAQPERANDHKAVLRFRSRAISDAVGVPFREVTVRKGVWSFGEGGFVQPNIRLANLYANKVVNRLADRSIWNLEPVQRYIAPEDFVEELTHRCRGRIHWETPIARGDLVEHGEKINTIPMSVLAEQLLSDMPEALAMAMPKFNYAPIVVKRWRIRGADVHQTVYFPDERTTLYRVSITGDLLIAEYMDAEDPHNFWPAFGVHKGDAEPMDTTSRRVGKISPIDDAWRRSFIHWLTQEHRVYSLGRFATWRNVLLDDVLQDVGVIKRLIHATPYDVARVRAGAL
jgi:hypothetical protein